MIRAARSILGLLLLMLANPASSQELTWDDFSLAFTRNVQSENDRLWAACNCRLGFRSTDDGTRWDTVTVQPLNFHEYLLTFKDLGNGRLLAGSVDGIHLSTDDGKTWKFVGGRGNAEEFIVADNGTIVQAGGASPDGIYLSTDQGATWTVAPGSKGWMESITKDDRGRLYAASSDGVYYSDDNGSNWARTHADTIKWTWDVIADHDTLWINSYSGVRRSTDRGVTWDYSSVDSGYFVWVIQDEFDGALYGLRKQTGIERSYDNGATWQEISQNMTTQQLDIARGEIMIHNNRIYGHGESQRIVRSSPLRVSSVKRSPFQHKGFKLEQNYPNPVR